MHEQENPTPDCTSSKVDEVKDEKNDFIKSHIKLEHNQDRCKILGLMKTPVAILEIDDSEDEESEPNAPRSDQITLTNQVKNVDPMMAESQCNEIGIKQETDIQAKKEVINDIDDIPILPAVSNFQNASDTNSMNFDWDYIWEEKENATLIESITCCQNDLKCEKINGQDNTNTNNEISHEQGLDDIIEIDDSDDDKNATKENNTAFKRKKTQSKTTSQSKIRNRIKCHVCDLFLTKNHLKIHMRTHTGEKPHQCNRCSKSFTRLFDLKTHMVVHVKEFPFNCSRCRFGFHSESEKITHEHKCKRSRYECDICKKFSAGNKYNFKTHMHVHTGKKPFLCEICMKSFNSKSNLKKHLGTIHEKKNQSIK